MVRVYNTAPQYIKITVNAGTPEEKELDYGEAVPAGTDVTVTFVQTPAANMDVQYKTFWQERPIKILEEGATSQTVTVEQSIWFYADYPDYDGTSAHGMIWEGSGRTHDLTVQHHFANIGTTEHPIPTSIVDVPFAEDSFGGTRPHFTYRVIHIAEPDNPENPDPYVVLADTFIQSSGEDITLVLYSELLPGKYYLTMIAEQNPAHRDAQFGFVNYMFIVKGHDYRVGLTWEASEGGEMEYSAWIADINGDAVQSGDVRVEGFIDGEDWVGIMEGHFVADGVKRPAHVRLSPIGEADPDAYSGLRVSFTPEGGSATGKYVSFYGIDSEHQSVDDLIVLAEPIPAFDIRTWEWKDVDSLIIFRASNEDLHPEEDALDCDVTVYYVTGTQGELPYVGRTSFELTIPWDRYLVTMPYGIDDIRDGEGGDPDARDLLVYNVSIGGELVALEICDPVDD